MLDSFPLLSFGNRLGFDPPLKPLDEVNDSVKTLKLAT